MRTLASLDRRATAALLTLVAFGVCAPAEAGGGKPAPKSTPPPTPTIPLPSGCVRVIDGRDAALSADGKWLAFGRTGFDRDRVNSDGSLARVPETWIRDLAAKKESKLPLAATPEQFTADGTLLLRGGFGVDPVKGTRVAGLADLPAGVDLVSMAWTRDGKRLAYIRRVTAKEAASIYLVEAGARPEPLAASTGIRIDQTVILDWSPDGSRLYVNALFDGDGDTGTRRVGFVEASSGAWKTLAEMPPWVDIPGLYAASSGFSSIRRLLTSRSGAGFVWGRSEGPRYGPDAWDATGRLVTWVDGHAPQEADAYVADVTTGESWRVTADGETKWSPALDGPGRRLALLMADDTGRGGKFVRRRIRVLDLFSGQSAEFPIPGSDGEPGALRWMPDGAQVLYEIRGGAIGGIFTQVVGAPGLPPDSTTIRAVEDKPKERILAWLASGSAERVDAAIDRASEQWDVAYVPALRAAVTKWVATDASLVRSLLRLLRDQRVKEAVPELKAALRLKNPPVVKATARTLLALGAKEALPELNEARGSATSLEQRVALAGAVAGLGDLRAWDDLRKAAKETQMEARREVCIALWRVRDTRSVELLIPWVDVKDSLGYHSVGERKTLGDAAQLALEALTGKSLGADPAAWTAWWTDEAKRTLPSSPATPADLEAVLGD